MAKEIRPATQLNYVAPRNKREATFSYWHNPTPNPVRLELYVGVDQEIQRRLPPGTKLSHEERTGLQVYEIGPGERVSLPSEFDKAIQDVRGGVICGGLGPQLRKVTEDGSTAKVHPALDPRRYTSPASVAWDTSGDDELLAAARALKDGAA